MFSFISGNQVRSPHKEPRQVAARREVQDASPLRYSKVNSADDVEMAPALDTVPSSREQPRPPSASPGPATGLTPKKTPSRYQHDVSSSSENEDHSPNARRSEIRKTTGAGRRALKKKKLKNAKVATCS